MELTKVLSQLESEHDLEAITKSQYRLAVNRFNLFLGRPARVADLTIDAANSWIAWLLEQYQLSPTTLCNHRSGLIRIWSYCASVLRLTDDCPTKRIRRPKRPPNIVRAWTLADLSILLKCSKETPGVLRCGIKASDFLHAWIWLGYESGFRPGDLRTLKWQAIDFERMTVTIVQKKTNGIHTASFGKESSEALMKLKEYDNPLVFPLRQYGVRRWEAILYREAEKCGFVRNRGQGFGTLRKTKATEMYKLYGLEAAAESLGHRSGTQTVRKHYVDSRESNRHVPPSPGIT